MHSLSDTVRQFCSQAGIRLNKDLGQHFLIDQEVLDATIEAGNIQPDDTIVEIGPGIGVLTKELLSRAKKVVAIEIDQNMIDPLAAYIAHNLPLNAKRLSLINQNALHTPLPNTPYKIVANIPYHITSPLIRHVFLESDVHPSSMTLLIQREVAENICSEKSASMLTILVGLFGKARMVTHVPPSCFLPPPKVDSSVIHIDVYKEPIADRATIEEIFKLTKHAFSQKRKMLRKSIGSLPHGMAILEAAEIDPTRRPQTLSIEEWKKLVEVSKQM